MKGKPASFHPYQLMCISKKVKLLSIKNEFKIYCGLISFVIHKDVALIMEKTKINE